MTTASFRAAVTEAELLEKNRAYDLADSVVWRRTVYDPVHDGWRFTNMGGRHVLDFVGKTAQVGPGVELVEFCSGLGDTCLYLAERYGCSVTGVELNVHQVERARARLEGLAPELAARMRFINSNILTWSPEREYDVVMMLDSLMLIDDPTGVLRKAREALRPNGWLFLAEMTAGAEMTEELARQVWDIDGIINLPTPDEYERLLSKAGFVEIQAADVTELAVSCFDRIQTAVKTHCEEIMSSEGYDVYRGWAQVADLYKTGFQDNKFGYLLLAAKRARQVA